jgi:hypothetical protein
MQIGAVFGETRVFLQNNLGLYFSREQRDHVGQTDGDRHETNRFSDRLRNKQIRGADPS